MYPPRSEKYTKKKQENQRGQSRFWLGLNLSIIFIIVVLGVYLYLEDRTSQGVDGMMQDNSLTNISEDIGGNKSNKPDDAAGQGPSDDAQPQEQHPEQEADPDANSPSETDEGDQEGIETQTGSKAEVGEEIDSEERLLIHFAGDTIFSGKVAEKLQQEGYDYPYRYVKDLFQNDDLSIVNLETPVTEAGTAAENKTYVFKSAPQALPELAKAGVEAVNLANNHSLDQGVEGLLNTIEHLKKSKLHYVGAGKNSKEAYAPVYIERKGIKIALCGFTRVIPESHWAAGKNPGVAAAYDSKQAVKAIQTARKQADLVLVVVHWGKERTTKLEQHQTTLAHEFIDAGADLVMGGHPHVLQGLEQYKGKWIAYSTGNFIFTKSKDPKTWETAVFAAACTRKGDCDMKLIPYKTEIGQPVPMNSEDGARLLKEVESYSPGISIGVMGEVSTSAPARDRDEQADSASTAVMDNT